ncbi:SA1362 family protein [Amphibacillus xylanus]|uniref:Uncharacterized protein n=1 Tax=Amphibacillus xylanus (strain ATCC 51415 / DSM 6626 / JCM 7361 / LMG 17667 / NBRC 15112 / Ep01) TaxID=698758 RepID=K0J3W6_AMPXN|nr:SA1362 family protein [Amphibacillus xylanus]BAM47291.1 hypothetical protein AXY_11590 [Amphibacillus xylanus NBRC 15112]
MRNKTQISPIILIIMPFALLGLLTLLFSSSMTFLKGTLIIATIVGSVFLFRYLFLYRRRINQDELRKYRKAAKQSRKRYQHKSKQQMVNTHLKKVTSISNKKKPNPPHLRVIDGKKSTKNDPLSL